VDVRFSRTIQIPVRDSKVATINIEKFQLIRVGDEAPAFTGKTLGGEDLKLEDFRGKVVLLDFWATWCTPCVAELPNVKSILEEHSADGKFAVIGVSLDSDRKMVERFVKSRAPWAHIVGGPAEENPIAKKYFVEGIPAVFLIDHEGKVVAKDLRGSELRRAVRKQVKRADEAQSRVTKNVGGS